MENTTNKATPAHNTKQLREEEERNMFDRIGNYGTILGHIWEHQTTYYPRCT